MAECSYAHCVQKRRYIKRELQKWTKSMMYILGLERVAEELMGRRKWKLYQEVLARSHLNSASNSNQVNITETEIARSNGQENLTHTNASEHSVQQQEQRSEDLIAKNYFKRNELGTISKDQDEYTNIKTETLSTEIESDHKDKSADETNKLTVNLIKEVQSETVKKEEPAEETPIDWKPQENCYFCDDGKLLTVNEKGDLEPEPGPVSAEPEIANKKIFVKNLSNVERDSDSDSSEYSDLESYNPALEKKTNKANIENLLKSLPPQNMTSLETMTAAQLAIAINSFPPFYSGLLPSPFVQQLHSSSVEDSASVISPPATLTSSPVEATAEQPLDLSAKSSSGSPFPSDSKQVFRAKPRVSAAPGRTYTYTEEEVNSALSDILSGKLGTRRAAALYGVPRSTLRNKVNKLASDSAKRECLSSQGSELDVLDQDDDDKDLSGGEDDKDIEHVLDGKDLRHEDIIGLTSARSTALQKYGNLFDSTATKSENVFRDQDKSQSSTPTLSQTSAMVNNSWLDPVMLQNLLISSLMQQNSGEPAVQEIIRNLLIPYQELMKEHLKTATSSPNEQLSNGKSMDAVNVLQKIAALQHQNIKSEISEHNVTGDGSLDNGDSAVILKIPSFKAPASSSGKNGDSGADVTPSPPMHSRSPHTFMRPGVSPPIVRQSNSSGSPPLGLGGKGLITLQEMMANSITRTFNQQQNSELINRSSIESMDQYKRPSISVIKNLGGTDMTRFGVSPNLMSSMNVNNANSNNANNSGGKGTRPKRGKYRNYDRDSLVEAVKAVQRGEMSVHRAGSYYGVPHSTLEYKVKERHLMRPRKREPKTQPTDSALSSTSNIKNQETSATSINSMRAIDKAKTLSSTTKPSIKSPTYSSTSQNGLKMGFIDPAQLQYAQQIFWPHSAGYTGLSMDFPRNAAGVSGGFPANAESFFASQVMQKFQEDALRHSNVGGTLNKNSIPSLPSASTTTSTTGSMAKTNQSKTARELSDTLYEGTSSNGSFLDGIIRQSLDRKSAEPIAHGVLLDHLVKNNRHNSTDGERNSNNKRAASPNTQDLQIIKRERNNSSSGETDRESLERDIMKESMEAYLSLRMNEKGSRQSDDVNGALSPDFKLSQNTHADDNT